MKKCRSGYNIPKNERHARFQGQAKLSSVKREKNRLVFTHKKKGGGYVDSRFHSLPRKKNTPRKSSVLDFVWRMETDTDLISRAFSLLEDKNASFLGFLRTKYPIPTNISTIASYNSLSSIEGSKGRKPCGVPQKKVSHRVLSTVVYRLKSFQ
jgi:hypothetical protein